MNVLRSSCLDFSKEVLRADKDVLNIRVKNGIPTLPEIPVGKRINQSMGSNQHVLGKDRTGDVL